MHEKTYEPQEKAACDRKPLASAAIAQERLKILSRNDCCVCGAEADYQVTHDGLYAVDCCNIDCKMSATGYVTAEQALGSYLPCPICGGIEGCDHTIPERRRALGGHGEAHSS